MHLKLLSLLLIIGMQTAFAQESEEVDISKRIFMPSIQMGMINHHSEFLSRGLFIQTSLEYQLKQGIFFRINYDDFDSDFELNTNESTLGVLKGEVSFSEFIGGVGYRQVFNKHNVLAIVQAGNRHYGFPRLQADGNNLFLEFDKNNVIINRYTLGYEYEIEKRVFLAVEFFTSQVWKQNDYWSDNAWASGFTIGVTTTIF